jgi:uncharacterized protein involved in exopolysaccharide biosynthesis
VPEQQLPPQIRGGTPNELAIVSVSPEERWLEDEIDFGWYVDALRRRWAWLAAAAVLGALAAAGVAASRARVYEAATTLMVVAPARTPEAPVNPQTFRAILESGSLAAHVVAELGLGEAPHRLTPQAFLERALTVETVTGTNIVRVKVRLQEPTLAAEASRRLSQKAIALTRQLSQQEGSSVQDLLKEHLNSAADRLATAEKALLTFQQGAQVELLKEDTQAMLDERGDLLKLVVAIESEKARLAAAEQEIKRQDPVLTVSRAVGAEEALRRAEAREGSPEQPAAAATGSQRPKGSEGAPAPPPERSTAADASYLDLTNPFVNPVYQTLDFQIATSRARLAALEQQRRQLVDVRRLGGEAFGQLSELYSRQIELARLQTNFDLAKRIHSDLTVRYEESRTQALGSSPQLQLIDEALPPDRAVSRRTLQLMVLGFAAALLAMSLVVIGVEGRPAAGRAGRR